MLLQVIYRGRPRLKDRAPDPLHGLGDRLTGIPHPGLIGEDRSTFTAPEIDEQHSVSFDGCGVTRRWLIMAVGAVRPYGHDRVDVRQVRLGELSQNQTLELPLAQAASVAQRLRGPGERLTRHVGQCPRCLPVAFQLRV